MYYKTTCKSPLGVITLMSDGISLTDLLLEAQLSLSSSKLESAVLKDNLEIFIKTKEWLTDYFAGKKPKISDIQIVQLGSSFRQLVWSVLTDIPYGRVITYGDIAKIIEEKEHKRKISAQAVGGAVGHNPISIIIPCHRVVGANKNLTGYAGGINKKIHLLEHEGIDITNYWYK